MLTMARLPLGRVASSLTAWLRMRAPVAANGWPSARLPPFGFTRSRGKRPKLCSTPVLARTKSRSSILEPLQVAKHLCGKGLMDLPQRDVVEAQMVSSKQSRDRGDGGHEQPFFEDVDGGDLKIDEACAWHVIRRTRETFAVGDPHGRRAVGQRRAVAGGERAASALPVEYGLQLPQLVE